MNYVFSEYCNEVSGQNRICGRPAVPPSNIAGVSSVLLGSILPWLITFLDYTLSKTYFLLASTAAMCVADSSWSYVLGGSYRET